MEDHKKNLKLHVAIAILYILNEFSVIDNLIILREIFNPFSSTIQEFW